jgi:hypothetical protein
MTQTDENYNVIKADHGVVWTATGIFDIRGDLGVFNSALATAWHGHYKYWNSKMYAKLEDRNKAGGTGAPLGVYESWEHLGGNLIYEGVRYNPGVKMYTEYARYPSNNEIYTELSRCAGVFFENVPSFFANASWAALRETACDLCTPSYEANRMWGFSEYTDLMSVKGVTFAWHSSG